MVVRYEPLGKERPEAIRRNLTAYEKHYGVPSERMEEAFMRRGKLRETEDYQRWKFLWTVWRSYLLSTERLPSRPVERVDTPH